MRGDGVLLPPLAMSVAIWPVFALVALLSIVLPGVHAQTSNATCLSGFEWVCAVAHLFLRIKFDSGPGLDVQLERTKSLLDHSVSGLPVFWGYVSKSCFQISRISTVFPDVHIDPLPPGAAYNFNSISICACSSVFYSMLQACATCQGGKIVT